VPYDESFKAEVLQYLRESGKSIGAVARERRIASSTLLRWQAQTPAAPTPKAVLQSREHPGTTSTLLDLSRNAAEIDELVTWLDRDEGEVRASLQRRIVRHNRWMKVYNAILIVLAWVILILAMGLGIAVYVDLQAAEPATPLRVYVAWTVGLLVAVYLTCTIVDTLFSSIANLRGPFVMAVLRLMTAEHYLAQDKAFTLVDPKWWNVKARWRRRYLRLSLREAEALLLRRTQLGRSYRTVGAREWELAQRRKAALALAAVEVQLERDGCQAYEKAGVLLRQLTYLTLLREWEVDRLPQLPEVATRYQSPLARLAQRLWMPVPLLGAVVTLVLALPELREALL
jgi:transposase-like protein